MKKCWAPDNKHRKNGFLIKPRRKSNIGKRWRQILTKAVPEPKKAKASAEYLEAKKDKRSIMSDKKNYIDGLALEAEEAAYQGNIRDLFSTIKKYLESSQFQRDQLKLKMGNQYLMKRVRKKRWLVYFLRIPQQTSPTIHTQHRASGTRPINRLKHTHKTRDKQIN